MILCNSCGKSNYQIDEDGDVWCAVCGRYMGKYDALKNTVKGEGDES